MMIRSNATLSKQQRFHQMMCEWAPALRFAATGVTQQSNQPFTRAGSRRAFVIFPHSVAPMRAMALSSGS